MIFRNALGFTLLSTFCFSAQAATYYVDSQLGNDTWSGQVSTVSGTNGPWRSLAKVAYTSLNPGDTVLLNCDRTWNETLTINQSGTADAPIKIAAANQGCANPPTISGLQQIPDYAWQPHSNGIWKVKFPYTLLKNGLLNEGNRYWRIWSTGNDATINSSVSACSAGKAPPCLNVKAVNSTGVLSSSTFALEKGETYSVSFSSLLSMSQVGTTGSMDSNVSKWSVWSPAQDLKIQPGAACLNNQAGTCLTAVSNTTSGLLSSSSFPVTKGDSYTLSFSAYIPSGKTSKAIVRQSSGAYAGLGLANSMAGTSTWKNYSYTFTALATEAAARLDFEIPAGSTVQFQNIRMNLPMTPIKTLVRQDGGSYQTLGLVASPISLDGVWKDSTYTFTANNTVANARLDFEIPANGTAQFQNIVLNKTQGAIAVSQLLESGTPQGVAHHPNKGYDSTNPDSMFFKTAATSPTVVDANGKRGSIYLTTDSDYFLPTGASIDVGTSVTVRDQGWDLSQVAVSSVTGSKIQFQSITTYPLYWKGLGYYFTNKLWMLDSVGEWYFDADGQTLYYAPNNVTPDNSIKLATGVQTGANLKGKNYIQLDGINFNGLVTGIEVSAGTNILLNNLDVRNVKATAVMGTNTQQLTLQNSRFTRIGKEAIRAWSSNNVKVAGNSFDQIGVFLDANSNIVSLPENSVGAVVAGANSVVSQNIIKNFAYVGINVNTNSTIQDNYLNHGCLVLNDCGALYVDYTSTGATIKGNVVSDLVGNINGLPSPPFSTHTVGIYADNGANGNIIDGNTVAYADFGIQLHDSYNQQVSNNLLYGARRNELWLQEGSKSRTATGDIHNVTVSGNKLFPTIPSGQMKMSSTVSSLEDFGSFDGEIFSNYYGPHVANETYNTVINYTLSQWQAVRINNLSRNLDPNGKVAAPLAKYSLGLLQSNIVPNANFQNGSVGWSKYGTNGTAPAVSLESCNPGQVTTACIKVVSSNVLGNLSTPLFDIKKDYYYMLNFDAQTSDPTQVITALVRQAGPTYYNGVMSTPLTGTQGVSGWKRYAVIFKATADARTDGSVAGVNGARIDFTGVKAGQTVWFANLELTQVGQQTFEKTASLITNPSFKTQSYSCPSTNTSLCNNYINFSTSTKVTWPITLPALGSAVVFVQNLDYPDSDDDGIPNLQDACPSSLLGAAVNSKGCELR